MPPEQFSEILEHELRDESYEFDLVGVRQRLSDQKWFWSTDSGCSCPSPWESHTEVDWNPLPETLADFEAAVQKGTTDGTAFIAQVKGLL